MFKINLVPIEHLYIGDSAKVQQTDEFFAKLFAEDGLFTSETQIRIKRFLEDLFKKRFSLLVLREPNEHSRGYDTILEIRLSEVYRE